MIDVIEHINANLSFTNLNEAHKRKHRSRLYHIVENDFTSLTNSSFKAYSFRFAKFKFKVCVSTVLICCQKIPNISEISPEGILMSL